MRVPVDAVLLAADRGIHLFISLHLDFISVPFSPLVNKQTKQTNKEVLQKMCKQKYSGINEDNTDTYAPESTRNKHTPHTEKRRK